MTSTLVVMLALGVAMSLTLLFAVFLPLLFPGALARAAFALERRLSGLRSRRLQAHGLNWVYSDGGRGEPLVLLHGIGGDRDHWTRVARGLRRRFRIIAPDLPGFGESAKPADGDYSIDGQVRALAGFLDALGLPRVHLGGSSMGGWIAAYFAARHPERVASLWLLAPGGVESAPPSEMLERVEAGRPVPLFARSQREFDAVLDFVFARRPWIPGVARRQLARRATDLHDLHNRIFAELFRERPALEPVAAQILAPTLIVWGDRDRVLHPDGADILERLLPHARAVRLPGIGHLPMLESPRRCAHLWLDFSGTARPQAVPA